MTYAFLPSPWGRRASPCSTSCSNSSTRYPPRSRIMKGPWLPSLQMCTWPPAWLFFWFQKELWLGIAAAVGRWWEFISSSYGKQKWAFLANENALRYKLGYLLYGQPTYPQATKDSYWVTIPYPRLGVFLLDNGWFLSLLVGDSLLFSAYYQFGRFRTMSACWIPFLSSWYPHVYPHNFHD